MLTRRLMTVLGAAAILGILSLAGHSALAQVAEGAPTAGPYAITVPDYTTLWENPLAPEYPSAPTFFGQ